MSLVCDDSASPLILLFHLLRVVIQPHAGPSLHVSLVQTHHLVYFSLCSFIIHETVKVQVCLTIQIFHVTFLVCNFWNQVGSGLVTPITG